MCLFCTAFLLTFLLCYRRIQQSLACPVLDLEGWHWFYQAGLHESCGVLLVCRVATLGGNKMRTAVVFWLYWRGADGWFDLRGRSIPQGPSRVRMKWWTPHPSWVISSLSPAACLCWRWETMSAFQGVIPVRGKIFLIFFNFHCRQNRKHFCTKEKKKGFGVQWRKSGYLSPTKPVSQAHLVYLISVTPLCFFSAHLQTSQGWIRADVLFCSVPAIQLLIRSTTLSSQHRSFAMLGAICPFKTNLVLLSLLCTNFWLCLSKVKNYHMSNSSQSCITHVLAKSNLTLPYVKSLLCFGWAGLSAALLCGTSPSRMLFFLSFPVKLV